MSFGPGMTGYNAISTGEAGGKASDAAPTSWGNCCVPPCLIQADYSGCTYPQT